jgi:GxxExxY protein
VGHVDALLERDAMAVGQTEWSAVTREEETARAQGSRGKEGLSEGKPLRFRQTPVGVNEVARRVVNAAIEVHRHLGPGYLESVYEAALEIELGLRGVSFEGQAAFQVGYKGQGVGSGRMDLLAERSVIVEVKAVEHLNEVHVAQALSYLKATGLPLALLLNFNVPVLLRGVKRIARNPSLEPQDGADETIDSRTGR